MGFVAVPRGELAALLDIVWVVPDGRVPDDGEGVDDEGEGDGTLDCEADPVTRLADAAGLLRILYRNLDSYVGSCACLMRQRSVSDHGAVHLPSLRFCLVVV